MRSLLLEAERQTRDLMVVRIEETVEEGKKKDWTGNDAAREAAYLAVLKPVLKAVTAKGRWFSAAALEQELGNEQSRCVNAYHMLADAGLWKRRFVSRSERFPRAHRPPKPKPACGTARGRPPTAHMDMDTSWQYPSSGTPRPSVLPGMSMFGTSMQLPPGLLPPPPSALCAWCASAVGLAGLPPELQLPGAGWIPELVLGSWLPDGAETGAGIVQRWGESYAQTL